MPFVFSPIFVTLIIRHSNHVAAADGRRRPRFLISFPWACEFAPSKFPCDDRCSNSVLFLMFFCMFAPWKRLEKMADMRGARIVVGYNYRNPESSDLISLLFGAGVAIWTNTSAVTLASLFRSSRCFAFFGARIILVLYLKALQEALRSCDAIRGRRAADLGGQGGRGDVTRHSARPT